MIVATAAGHGGDGRDAGHEQWSGGVAEFAADFGRAHGLAEPIGR